MDSLFNILGNRDFDEPPEIAMIKRYIKSQYNTDVGVKVRDRDIVILVPSSALANTLRLNGPTIKRYCGVDKSLTFRIGK